MSPTTDRSRGAAPLQDVDVLIVGAGSSGIGAARRLRQRTPCSSYAIIEAGTSIDHAWDPFRYSGTHVDADYADSEMSTLGRAFLPGTGPVADDRETLDRIPDRASESGASEQHTAHGPRVLRASWSGAPAHWIVTLQDCESGTLATMSCSFLYLCSGRHRDAEGRTPARPGPEDFAGAAARRRWRSVQTATALYRLRPRYPTSARALIRKSEGKWLPKDSGFDRLSVQTHEPWDQRTGLVPDGDFLHARQSGLADIMTDRLGSSTETGPRLRFGRTPAADAVLTPTGLDPRDVGGIELTVDGAPIVVPAYVLHRGMMLDGVPNLVFAPGSGDASGTLRTDLVSDHVARLVAYMEERGYTAVTPRPSPRAPETSPVAEMFSGRFHRPGDASPPRGARTLRRLRGRSGQEPAFFRGPVAAKDLEFTPADV